MALDPKLFEIISQLTRWAETKTQIRRVWIFGSRLKGTQRQDSDLDIAIEIDPISTDETTQTKWRLEKAEWESELQEISPYKVSLWMYGQPDIVEFINSCSMLILERTESS